MPARITEAADGPLGVTVRPAEAAHYGQIVPPVPSSPITACGRSWS